MRSAAALSAVAVALLVAGCDRAAAPSAPAALEAISVVEQEGVAGAHAAAPPAVLVLGDDGRPLPGAQVHFAITAGDGVLPGEVVTSDNRGEARLASWRLGTVAGDNAVTATIAGLASPGVTFRATGRAGPPARLGLLVEPAPTTTSGGLLLPQPVLQLFDEHGNPAPVAGVTITATVTPATLELEDNVAVTGSSGRAAFEWLRLHGQTGSYTLSFSAPAIGTVAAAAQLSLVPEAPGICSGAMPLAFALGETRRVSLDRPRGMTCLDFDIDRSAGQQYLVLMENMPLFGPRDGAFFDAAMHGQLPSARDFSYSLRSMPRDAAGNVIITAGPRLAMPAVPEDAGHSWDFGEGPIYEIRPEPPAGGVAEPYIMNTKGQALGLSSSSVTPMAGDTIHGIWMERLTHLGIPTGQQSAVIRYVSDALIIAEDVRLPTLQRQDGGFNTPLHADTLQAIAREYERHSRQQSDMLFDGRHNAAVTNIRGGRVLAVHSIMYATNIWGYTYSSTDYFVFDYWVGQTLGRNGTLNQRVQRVVDNLFMHEVAHMREIGLLQQAGVANRRGNTWFVEGFARFTERLPIAARLLDTADPSRTGNVVLPMNSAFGTAFFRDDVPTYLSMTGAAFSGYQNSSYVFDYFADQVALQGGDWRSAIREFVIAAGRPTEIDALTTRWTGVTLPELFTRARIALFLDDIGKPGDNIGTSGLPDWTQYHQFRLRDSRPVTTGTDPRTAFLRLAPGQPQEISHILAPGAAWGWIIDGQAATGSARFSLSGPTTSNAVVSVTRIR
jgi:hypothetical protein